MKVIDQMLRDLENKRVGGQNTFQGQINATNITSTTLQKRIETLEDDKKKWILSWAKTPEEKEMLLNVGIDTVSLEKNLLDMTMKSVSESELTKMGHTLDEMLKYCRWSYYSCHKG